MDNSRYANRIINTFKNAPNIRMTESGIAYRDKSLYLKNNSFLLKEDDGDDINQGQNINLDQQPQDTDQDQQPQDTYYPKRDRIDLDKDVRTAVRRDFRSGVVLLYAYHPKWVKILDFYDALPITMLFRVQGDRMHGFNLHYLPPQFRSRIVDTMIRQKRGAGGFSYRRLQRFMLHLPYSVLKYGVRTYLYNHIISRVKFIPERYLQQILMEVAPQFYKRSASEIYNFIIREVIKKR